MIRESTGVNATLGEERVRYAAHKVIRSVTESRVRKLVIFVCWWLCLPREEADNRGEIGVDQTGHDRWHTLFSGSDTIVSARHLPLPPQALLQTLHHQLRAVIRQKSRTAV